MKYPYNFLALITFTSVILSCTATDKNRNAIQDSLNLLKNVDEQKVAVLDSATLFSFFERFPKLNVYKKNLRDFYRNRKFAYAWYDNGLLNEQAYHLSNQVLNISSDGIYRPVPYVKVLDSLINSLENGAKNVHPNPTIELMLTAQYFLFSKITWHGQDDSVSRSNGWFIPRKKIAYAQLLDSLLKESDSKNGFRAPVYRQYGLLKSYLKKYRDLSSASWPILTDSIIPLRPGDSAEVIMKIRTRLLKLGDYEGDTLNNRFDKGFIGGLKHFQQRHGLKEDGLLGAETFAELNIPLVQRINQIIVNMERCRWLPVRSDGDYLAVNIPEYKLHVYHKDSLQWSCNVVVGQSWSKTMIFWGSLKYVVFSPYWNLPESIVKKEVVPGIEKDSTFLSKHNMEITGYHGSTPIIRQRPGSRNSLGQVKFLFPNRYSIYMHDTPSKSLFGETKRAFSHGCIRVVEPVKLAKFLLKNQKQWTKSKIVTAMKSGREKYVLMKKPIPVYIAYLTAFCDRNNVLNFRNDIYNLDEGMAATLIVDH